MARNTSFIAEHLGEVVLGAVVLGYAAGRSARKALDGQHALRDDELFATTRDQYDHTKRAYGRMRAEEATRYVA